MFLLHVSTIKNKNKTNKNCESTKKKKAGVENSNGGAKSLDLMKLLNYEL